MLKVSWSRLANQNSGQTHNELIDSKTFENVAKFIYLAVTLIIRYFIHEEIKDKLNSGNASYHSVQNLLS
jgi:hypothetical protein